jgi:hypothetical protein
LAADAPSASLRPKVDQAGGEPGRSTATFRLERDRSASAGIPAQEKFSCNIGDASVTHGYVTELYEESPAGQNTPRPREGSIMSALLQP